MHNKKLDEKENIFVLSHQITLTFCTLITLRMQIIFLQINTQVYNDVRLKEFAYDNNMWEKKFIFQNNGLTESAVLHYLRNVHRCKFSTWITRPTIVHTIWDSQSRSKSFSNIIPVTFKVHDKIYSLWFRNIDENWQGLDTWKFYFDKIWGINFDIFEMNIWGYLKIFVEGEGLSMFCYASY